MQREVDIFSFARCGSPCGYIASTDFDELGGYWLDNFVHVGQIEGNFIDNEEFEPDTEIIVQVYATFENGEEIDQYSYLTLQPNINPYTEVRTFFRGKIVEYSVKIFNKI